MRSTNTLDLFRVIAIFMVITVHLGQYIFPHGAIMYDICHIGLYGVPVFFALSGYLVSKSLCRSSSIADFYSRRVLRLLPAYYVCLLATCLLVPMPIDELGLGWIRYFTFTNLFLPSSHTEWVNINGYWCMPVFMWFYLVIPLILRFCGSFIKIISLTVVCSLIAIIYCHYNSDITFNASILIMSFPCFLWGTTSAFVKGDKLLLSGILFVMLIISLLFSLTSYIPWAIVTSLLIIWCNKTIKGSITSQVVRYLSNISFNLYLVHMLVLRIMVDLHLDTKVFVLFFLVISFVLATMLYYCIDKNVVRIQNKRANSL